MSARFHFLSSASISSKATLSVDVSSKSTCKWRSFTNGSPSCARSGTFSARWLWSWLTLNSSESKACCPRWWLMSPSPLAGGWRLEGRRWRSSTLNMDDGIGEIGDEERSIHPFLMLPPYQCHKCVVEKERSTNRSPLLLMALLTFSPSPWLPSAPKLWERHFAVWSDEEATS